MSIYRDIPNPQAVLNVMRHYSMSECVRDFEFFVELRQDLLEQHPDVPYLEVVLDRILQLSHAHKDARQTSDG
jgi:hypothetical protein|tara:strand:- start:3134 stop:3352 length:219 start_codon:yes stop_codon:yes gene_type:complete